MLSLYLTKSSEVRKAGDQSIFLKNYIIQPDLKIEIFRSVLTNSTFWHGISSPGESTNVSTEFLQSFNVLGDASTWQIQKAQKTLQKNYHLKSKRQKLKW